MDYTDTLPTNLPNDWVPAPPIPTKDDLMKRYDSMHFDRPDATVDVQYLGGRKGGRSHTIPAMTVEQSTEVGVEEQLRVFFSAKDPEVQLALADALEGIAEQLRDNASAAFATFLATERREAALRARIEQANDESGFDNGRAA